MNSQKRKAKGRVKRKLRVRRRVFGEPGRPRLTIFRSLGQIYAQIVDDVAERTLVAASSLSKDLKGEVKSGGNIESAKIVGKLLGEKAKAAGIEQVTFDRNGYRFHGRVKAFADAAREAGLKF
jgi:large subunit ribosomal protein L18